MSNLRNLLEKQKFAPNAKVNKLLSKANSTDLDLAKASLTTKAYKENEEVRNMVDKTIAGTLSNEEKIEPTRVSSSAKSGERRTLYSY